MNISVTLIIVIISSVISILCFKNRVLMNKLIHHPYTVKRHKEYYRWLTSGFIHGSWLHLGINMYVLYEFGTIVESIFQKYLGVPTGAILYLGMYLLIIVLSSLPSYAKHQNNARYAALGASGGVAGVLFAFILYAPWSMLGLYFVIPIPAIIFGALYLWYESWAAKNMNDNIGHDAHFYGAIAGVLLTIIIRPSFFPEFIDKLVHNIPFG